MIDIRQKFSEFNRPEYFSRIDSVHILELHLGLDEKSRKAIELRYPFTPRKVTGTYPPYFKYKPSINPK